MSKTAKQRIDEQLEALQLQLIEEDALIEALTPVTLPDHMGDSRARDYGRRVHEAKRDAIRGQIAFLAAKKSKLSPSTGHSQKSKTTKQERVYKEILKMKKKNSNFTNEEAFEQLADKQGGSEEAIRKAFYAEQKKLNDEQTSAAREKRDSKGKSDEGNRGGK
jgi:hypothetical protein